MFGRIETNDIQFEVRLLAKSLLLFDGFSCITVAETFIESKFRPCFCIAREVQFDHPGNQIVISIILCRVDLDDDRVVWYIKHSDFRRISKQYRDGTRERREKAHPFYRYLYP